MITDKASYDKAKAELKDKQWRKDNLQGSAEFTWHMKQHITLISAALLAYRRAHNIFEVGDKVVFRECSGIGGASDAIDLMTVKSIDAFGVRMTNSLCPWAIQIRHATDEEIKAGKRLEVNQ